MEQKTKKHSFYNKRYQAQTKVVSRKIAIMEDNYKERLIPFIKDLPFPQAKELWNLIDFMIHKAYVAGALGTKGIGLNYTNEERADQYCKEKGLRQ